MKKTNIAYWIVTGLLSAFMLFSAIPNILVTPDSVTLFKSLGYPVYLVPFLGVAKLLGAVAILVPGNPRLKEWAYAGFTFDLAGAMYSIISLGAPLSAWSFFIIFLALVAASYLLHHKRAKLRARAMRETPVAQPQLSLQGA